jgi:hypothetical protein
LAFVSSAAVDVTGITLSLAVIGTGAVIRPRRRARAKGELHGQLQALRDGLEASLDRQLAHELERAGSDLAGAIAPYTRFVRSETERLTELAEAMEAQARSLADLRTEIEGLEPAEE